MKHLESNSCTWSTHGFIKVLLSFSMHRTIVSLGKRRDIMTIHQAWNQPRQNLWEVLFPDPISGSGWENWLKYQVWIQQAERIEAYLSTKKKKDWFLLGKSEPIQTKVVNPTHMKLFDATNLLHLMWEQFSVSEYYISPPYQAHKSYWNSF